MRVITGSRRGSRLSTLPGEDVRPTPERVKEAVFSAIQFDIEGRRMLDLFGGSGQMGIEALSRGASFVRFCEINPAAADVIEKNLEKTGFSPSAAVSRCDYRSCLSLCRETFDIAFLDPPYDSGCLPDALPRVTAVMSDAGIILCEHPSYVSLPESTGGFALARRYRYGKVHVSLYRKEEFI